MKSVALCSCWEKHLLPGSLSNCSPWVNHSDTHVTQFDKSKGTLAANAVDGLNSQVGGSAHRGQLLLSGHSLPHVHNLSPFMLVFM
jgi:hypothetical protein